MIRKNIKNLLLVLIFVFPTWISSFAGDNYQNDCEITIGSGCCPICNYIQPYNYEYCWEDTTPVPYSIYCGANPGYCDCQAEYCNSPYDTNCNGGYYDDGVWVPVTDGRYIACYTCCCTLEDGSSGGGGSTPPGDITQWAGVKGKVWTDKNKDGNWDLGEEYFGYPMLTDAEGNYRCNGDVGQIEQPYSVMINNINFARVWMCYPDDAAYYYSHYDEHWTQPGLVRNSSYTATLGNLPAGFSCGNWKVTLGNSSVLTGEGCNASFTTSDWGYTQVDWELIDSPTSPPAEWVRILGFMWSDEDGSGNHNVISNRWRGSDLLTCSITQPYIFTNFRILTSFDQNYSKNVITSWGCTNDHQWYGTAGYNIRGDSVGIRLDTATTSLPTGYECESWIARTASIARIGSGPGCDISNITMPASEDLWVFWKMKKTCTPDCIYGTWGDCSGGVQTRTATSVCGGVCNDTTRNCLRISGVIWNEDPTTANEFPVDGEEWFGEEGMWCGSAGKFWDGFDLNYTGFTGNKINDWICNSTNSRAYYTTPYDIVPSSTIVATLNQDSLPSGSYICDSWWYKNESHTYEDSGSDCTTDPLNFYPEIWRNINWKIHECKAQWVYDDTSCSTLCGPGILTVKTCELSDPRCEDIVFCDPNEVMPCNVDNPCTYDVVFDLRDLPNDFPFGDCGGLLGITDKLPDATVSAFREGFFTEDTSNNLGIVKLTIPFDYPTVYINSSKTTSGETPDVWELICPKRGTFEHDFSVDDPRIIPAGTIPADGTSTTPEIDLPLGLKKIYKEGWTSVVDADVFASASRGEDPSNILNILSVDVAVPKGSGSSPAGFVKALINSKENSGTNMGGFVFTDGVINRPTIEDDGTNHIWEDPFGGKATQLFLLGKSHRSTWLEEFSFEAPPTAQQIEVIPSSFESGVVYNILGENFSANVDDLEGYIVSGSGVAILYVVGDIFINNPITTSSTGKLLLVVNGSVKIDKGIGYTIGYDILDSPNIDAGIIASGIIEFKHGDVDDYGEGTDIPIMLSAPLISNEDIALQRDLGHGDNATTPAHAVKQFNKYLYYLSDLERNKSEDMLYFTGLTSYSLDWEYIY